MYYFDNFHGKKILKSTLVNDVDCFFTTRDFVLTPSCRDDLIDESERNRKFLEDKLGCKITTCKQTHSDNIAFLEPEKNFYDNTDAIITNKEYCI